MPMEAFGQSHPAHNALPATSTHGPSSKRRLPNGACNYRDVAVGTCGCNQFWDKCSAELHEGSTEKRSSHERSTWCVCGHHACFHLQDARAAAGRLQSSMAGASYRVHARCNGRCQLQPGSQCNLHRAARPVDEDTPSLEGSQDLQNGRLKTSQAVSSQSLLQQAASPAIAYGQNGEVLDPPSQPSTSGLPRVPSVCFLSHDRPTAAADTDTRKVRTDMSQPRHNAMGLGLSLVNLGNTVDQSRRQPSVTSTVPDEIDRAPHGFYSESELPSTRANSVPDENAQETRPAPNPMDRILDFNRNLHLDVGGDTIPNTCNPEDFLQSATEVATPSNSNTPDLGAVDHAVHDTKKIIETLARFAEQYSGSGARSNGAALAPAPQRLLTGSPATPQEQLQHALKSASPQALQKLLSYLNPLHNLLNSIPNVASTIQEIITRLDLLENSSFNFVQPDDFQQHVEMYDGRLLELEHRMDEHDRLHQAIDADQSSNSHGRRRIATTTDSFGSNHSAQSTTSSALIVAAIDRKDMETEIEGLKDRLDTLEAASLPTVVNPWQVEVVLLPWGRELRGIWFSPDEPMHDPLRGVTQDTEEWTQIRSSVSAPQSMHQGSSQPSQVFEQNATSSLHSSTQHSPNGSILLSNTGSGWSNQAISDWAAGPMDEWLSPKACGSNNLVYRRLQSRGFIRSINLKSANSSDIQAALSDAFGDLHEHLVYTDADYHPTINSYPGLRASFIPLRKTVKSSRLRFLSHAEMSSSALWSAQFLNSGVMMRVSGGKKRLYITQREAYLQQNNNTGDAWTWQQLRLLPRFQPDPDSEMEGNEEHCQPQVAEADAREACWAFFEAYDPPLSTTSSFSSSHSVNLSMRPAGRTWRRSITPSSILKNKQFQPISPLSENHPRRPTHGGIRTVSAPTIEERPHSSSKRRFNTSPVKPSSVPQPSSRSASISRPKRRRVARSPSPQAAVNVPSKASDVQDPVWNPTPRRSREPPSPFYSSHPELPRTNSDVTSRSQRSLAVVGKNTPFAYATPHSGPIVGAGSGFGEFADQAGDTEVDDNDAEYEDDGQSWAGVEDKDDDEDGSSDSDAEGGAEMEDQASFSGEDGGFGSDDEDNDDGEDGDDDFGFGAQQQEEDEDEDGNEVFDSLLRVLRE
ncbi:uncharacterized protein BDR25DRAFT_299608 [Lindgomyces ingoldianus]|uniref:Uncharacterized protein n=1 Tax=Lindgomyces ingoldianus TaxID=673940 RepID=A0ACB6RGI3_9PLEO|nr:uncharacterized protein BDR25DRAFT_299608 [Lindgomyces ingoldianus]KAF2477835.1 hypothetical protein BDR25DRAFT_299608 [Lindgomyces ingoldianus]